MLSAVCVNWFLAEVAFFNLSPYLSKLSPRLYTLARVGAYTFGVALYGYKFVKAPAVY